MVTALSQVLAVAVGGALGSIVRFGFKTFFKDWNTWVVNMLGCLIIGWVIGEVRMGRLTKEAQVLFLTTGFLGGLTTFSTYMIEASDFVFNRDWTTFIVNSLGQLMLGFALVRVGLWFAMR